MGLTTWEHFFKPEVRNAGRAFVVKGQVVLMRPSDTEQQATIRTSSWVKVQFKTPSMDSPLVTVNCTCPQSKKGQFCKHMWATLVMIEEKNPDFFSSKTDLQTLIQGSKSTKDSSKISQKQTDYQNAYKTKQAEYRKQQYQLQKERAQKLKKGKKANGESAVHFPSEVESALQYFSENGFPLRDSLNAEAIALARKKLARVFHPDHGGSHDEIVELNRFTEILIRFSNY
jgi:hypothetical protein